MYSKCFLAKLLFGYKWKIALISLAFKILTKVIHLILIIKLVDELSVNCSYLILLQ